ncbi:Lrp/AsnC family transcriptional regulator [Paenibacillus larvae]|uniref:Lrp/AsnC family transcriptional regulator n=1 Tax=Paenibacillus larvae TaxID=1464 RepID=A0AAP5JX06_9BACL|nr:Lrp/AsnC family transcriptional regulator [Paenibacillus larvae]AQR76965.1 AsnC family transcriptional regulator [Paenibacillus larvae subsp. larvae]AVF22114.1 transcriptional regulator [Paenibacillus larvae subsp. larvae]ETK27046.1 transcriptional regulator [Paenibacillus larvae subsp. larvae DSM 25719]MCY7475565.1 Lrp/AsnC family transcriptional regulator [Paenibacillus larvae]MCY7489320.1 Lrp/AsnC family transcriptional regulator [Paenibacillus larvae]
MEFKHLDETDTQIIKLLSENGRLSHAELGRLIGLTRAALRERVHHLVEDGIIDKFTIVVNPLKAGKMLSMYFDIEVEWIHLHQVIEQLTAAEEITNIYQMSGKPHLHVHALLDDSTHAGKMMKKLQKIEGITSVQSEVLIARYKERGGMLI